MEKQKDNQQEEEKKRNANSTAPASAEQQDKKEDQSHKSGVDPDEEAEESRFGGLKGGDNFHKNLGCGG